MFLNDITNIVHAQIKEFEEGDRYYDLDQLIRHVEQLLTSPKELLNSGSQEFGASFHAKLATMPKLTIDDAAIKI